MYYCACNSEVTVTSNGHSLFVSHRGLCIQTNLLSLDRYLGHIYSLKPACDTAALHQREMVVEVFVYTLRDPSAHESERLFRFDQSTCSNAQIHSLLVQGVVTNEDLFLTSIGCSSKARSLRLPPVHVASRYFHANQRSLVFSSLSSVVSLSLTTEIECQRERERWKS